jgi:polyribonucleotide nucleotidyltransferase
MVTTPIEGALRVRATVADDPAGDKEVTMEAGRLASLADGSVLVDFFPLTIDVEERCTPPARSPARSSVVRAGPPRPPSSPAG